MRTEDIIQGDSIVISIQLKTAAGVPIDLTGATARTSIVDSYDTVLYTKTIGLISAPLEGRIFAIIPSSTTNVMVGSTLFSDVEVTYSTGEVRTYDQVQYNILKGYTNG